MIDPYFRPPYNEFTKSLVDTQLDFENFEK